MAKVRNIQAVDVAVMIQQSTLRKFWPLAGAVMIWGGNWPVMKLGLAHMSPLWLAASRFGSAALISVVVLAALRRL